MCGLLAHFYKVTLCYAGPPSPKSKLLGTDAFSVTLPSALNSEWRGKKYIFGFWTQKAGPQTPLWLLFLLLLSVL